MSKSLFYNTKTKEARVVPSGEFHPVDADDWSFMGFIEEIQAAPTLSDLGKIIESVKMEKKEAEAAPVREDFKKRVGDILEQSAKDAKWAKVAREFKKKTEEEEKENDIEFTLSERGSRYGEFDEHARITQEIKRIMISGRSWDIMSDPMKEALDMVAHKIGRIVNGDPYYADSWHDIVGYVRLVEKTL